MRNIERANDVSLAEFLAGWDRQLHGPLTTVGFAVMGLTNFGEHPIQSTRLAELLGLSVTKAEALVQGHCTTGKPVEDGYTRVEDGLITFDPGRAPSGPRRQLQIGDRRLGMTGCAPDVILYAPLVRPSLQVEETCPATGTPIRVVFTPSRVESVDPADAVVAMPPVQVLDCAGELTVWEVDANICAKCPFYSSHGGGARLAGQFSWRTCLPRQRGVGSERFSRLAGADVGPIETQQLITGPDS
jgi:alkylmercury lyase-like protein